MSKPFVEFLSDMTADVINQVTLENGVVVQFRKLKLRDWAELDAEYREIAQGEVIGTRYFHYLAKVVYLGIKDIYPDVTLDKLLDINDEYIQTFLTPVANAIMAASRPEGENSPKAGSGSAKQTGRKSTAS